MSAICPYCWTEPTKPHAQNPDWCYHCGGTLSARPTKKNLRFLRDELIPRARANVIEAEGFCTDSRQNIAKWAKDRLPRLKARLLRLQAVEG